ncbi:hypothetical protein BJY01DRAFT_203631 [Aspergillus pseudoustus]|uniref:Secreted protein n=1 Tax=Aspergillus pseudoustus TaxID=1810923 RepID=A0ABR4KUN4_9EURO
MRLVIGLISLSPTPSQFLIFTFIGTLSARIGAMSEASTPFRSTLSSNQRRQKASPLLLPEALGHFRRETAPSLELSSVIGNDDC